MSESNRANRLSHLSRSIDGSVAVVTGAASGMGRATAFLFADEGARLALIDINGDALADVAATIEAAGGEVLPLVADCSDQAQLTAVVQQAGEHFGAIDIIVNNAGLVVPAALWC